MKMTTNIISNRKNKDGTITVLYFGKEAGWVRPSTISATGKRVFKALTKHGSIKHFDTLDTASNWLIGEQR
jgi:hypothetical protein